MNTMKRTILAAAAASAVSFTFGCRGDVDAEVESQRQAEQAQADTRNTDAVTGKKLEFDSNGKLEHEENDQGTGGSGPVEEDCEGLEASTDKCEGQNTQGNPDIER